VLRLNTEFGSGNIYNGSEFHLSFLIFEILAS
jgi:hypothetical protein